MFFNFFFLGLTSLFSASFWDFEHKLFSISAHQGLREYMEDRVFCHCDPVNAFSIFSVFDGHGGAVSLEYMSKPS